MAYLFRLTTSDLNKILAANNAAIEKQLNGNLGSLLTSQLESVKVAETVFESALSESDVAYLNSQIKGKE